MLAAMSEEARRNRTRTHLLSRTVICVVNAGALGTLFANPQHRATSLIDMLLRTYLIFLGTVMAHEAVHGHLGRSRRANLWWGSVALLGSMVPFTNFRKTHRLHHAHTNLPDKDPDYFLRSRSALEIPWRAVAMPHHWFFWLRSRGMLTRGDLVELAVNYAGILTVYGVLLILVGPARLASGMGPPLVLTSLLLWYVFAIKTHEGYSTGSAESRSHNYYGRAMYWFSLGLSMHRAHHLQPGLTWLALRDHVERAPAPGVSLVPRRDVGSAAVFHESLDGIGG